MLRHSLKAALVIVALSCLVQGTQASGRQASGGYHRRIGGYGRGPFGHGDVYYNGWTSNTKVRGRYPGQW
jgi:hypothetical protein